MMQTYKEKVEILNQADGIREVEFRYPILGLSNPEKTDWNEAYGGTDVFREETEIRLKPKPKLIPWTCETAPDNLMIKKDHLSKGCYIQVNVANLGIWYLDSKGNQIHVDYDDLIEDWEQRDGSPCGTMEEN